jgi:hypothetical protein
MSSTFNFFNYTCNSCERCFIAIDTPTMTNQSDAESSKLCLQQCEWICWPLCFTFDIISCPCRFSHYAYHNVSCTCKSCFKKKNPKITIHPYHNSYGNNFVVSKQPN